MCPCCFALHKAFGLPHATSEAVCGAEQMATGKPPMHELHPMRVLFLIPKEAAPVLEGPFSRAFKGFVALCLQKVRRAFCRHLPVLP